MSVGTSCTNDGQCYTSHALTLCANGACACGPGMSYDSGNQKCVPEPCSATAMSGYCPLGQGCFSGKCMNQTCRGWNPTCNSCIDPITPPPSTSTPRYASFAMTTAPSTQPNISSSFGDTPMANGYQVLTSLAQEIDCSKNAYLNIDKNESVCINNQYNDGTPIIPSLSRNTPLAFNKKSLSARSDTFVGTNFGNWHNQSELQFLMATDDNKATMSPSYCSGSADATDPCFATGSGSRCAPGTTPINITGWKEFDHDPGGNRRHYSVWGCQNMSNTCPDKFWQNMIYDTDQNKYVVACQRIPLPNTFMGQGDQDHPWCASNGASLNPCNVRDNGYFMGQGACGDNAQDVRCAEFDPGVLHTDIGFATTSDQIGVIPYGFYYKRHDGGQAMCSNPNGCTDYAQYYQVSGNNTVWDVRPTTSNTDGPCCPYNTQWNMKSDGSYECNCGGGGWDSGQQKCT